MARQAIYDVNDFLLNGTPVGAMLGWPNADSLVPIVPVQDQPEIQNGETPWVVYNVRTISHPDMWWQSTDEVMFVLYFDKVVPLNDVSTEMFDIFRRMDDSASDINAYLRGVDRNNFQFLSVRIVHNLSPAPADNRGGIYAKVFTIRYDYLNNSGRGLS